MFIRIPDPKTATKERGEKNCCPTFICSHKNHKTENYFIFELAKKKIWVNLHRIIELFTQRIGIKLSKYRFGSGVKKTPDPRFGSATLQKTDPQHCKKIPKLEE
jgi:hypothetical protein